MGSILLGAAWPIVNILYAISDGLGGGDFALTPPGRSGPTPPSPCPPPTTSPMATSTSPTTCCGPWLDTRPLLGRADGGAVMGTALLVTAAAATISDAYRDAVADDHYPCGHGGYFGTIAEKSATSTSGHSPPTSTPPSSPTCSSTPSATTAGTAKPSSTCRARPPTRPGAFPTLFGAGTRHRSHRRLRRQVGTGRRRPAPHRQRPPDLRVHGLGVDMTQRCPWCHGTIEGVRRGPAWFERVTATHELSCPGDPEQAGPRAHLCGPGGLDEADVAALRAGGRVRRRPVGRQAPRSSGPSPAG